MGDIGRYLLSVTTAAIVCGFLRQFLQGNDGAATFGKKLCGLFLLFTILCPSEIDLWDNGDWIPENIKMDAQHAVALGSEQTQNALSDIIKSRVQAYILDKGAQFDAQLEVDVILSEDTIPCPVQIRISGEISPYGKTQLQAIMENDLGVPKENQIWI